MLYLYALEQKSEINKNIPNDLLYREKLIDGDFEIYKENEEINSNISLEEILKRFSN